MEETTENTTPATASIEPLPTISTPNLVANVPPPTEALPLNEGFAFPVTRQLMRILGSYQHASKDVKVRTSAEGDSREASPSPSGITPSYKETRQKLVSDAPEVVSSIMRFVQSFRSFTGDEEGEHGTVVDEDAMANLFDPDTYMPGIGNKDGEAVQALLGRLEKRLQELGYAQKCSGEEWGSTSEALERLLMLKLYRKVFQVNVRDRELDAALSRRIQSLSFITPEHLDIRVYCQTNNQELMEKGWAKAAEELNKMNLFKTPKDKVICVVNCCRRVTKLLLDGLNSGCVDGHFKQPGADDLLPSLIYTVLRANPANLHSNIEFIAAFRSPARLTSETRYFFTFLTSAVAWIHQVDHTYLSGISEKEFVDAVQRSDDQSTEEEKEESSVEPDGERASTEGKPTINEDEQENDLEEEEVDIDVDMEKDNRFHASMRGLGDVPSDSRSYEEWKRKHLRFQSRSVETLTIDDVSKLLEEYKYLAGLIDNHASRSKTT